MPPLNIGIVTHMGDDAVRFERFLSAAFPDVVIAAKVFPSGVDVLTPVERAGVMAQIEAWIEARPLNLVFLETNLGQGGKSVSTFNRAFFQQLPDVRFVLFDGSNVDVEALRGTANILSFAQKSNVFNAFQEAVHDATGDLATIPDERGPTIGEINQGGTNAFDGGLVPGGNVRNPKVDLTQIRSIEANGGDDSDGDSGEPEGGG